MHNYLFTLSIYSTQWSLYILLYLYKKCTTICLFCQYTIHCTVRTFYYILPTNAKLCIHSNSQYTVHCAVCTFYYICPTIAQLSVYPVNIQYTVQFVHFIISVQKMQNYLFTLTVHIQYTVQFVHFIIFVQQMHNYLFTLTVNLHYTVQFVHLLYLPNKCTIFCLL